MGHKEKHAVVAVADEAPAEAEASRHKRHLGRKFLILSVVAGGAAAFIAAQRRRREEIDEGVWHEPSPPPAPAPEAPSTI